MLYKLPLTESTETIQIPINSCFVLCCYLHQLWKYLNSPFRVFRWILVQSADWHAVGWSCSVAACHITVSSCQICFDRFQSLGCVFNNCQGGFFEWPLRRCSFFWNVLLLHWTLDQCGGKRSGPEVFWVTGRRAEYIFSSGSERAVYKAFQTQPVWML